MMIIKSKIVVISLGKKIYLPSKANAFKIIEILLRMTTPSWEIDFEDFRGLEVYLDFGEVGWLPLGL